MVGTGSRSSRRAHMKLQSVTSLALGAWLSVVGVGCGVEDMEAQPEAEVLDTQEQALISLRATSTNVSVLANSCWSSGYQLWDGCGLKGGKDLVTWFSKAAFNIGTIKGTKVSNGQCAAFVINV